MVRHAGVLATAAVLWAVSVASTDVDRVGGHGLVDALPLTWYAALLLLLCGFPVALLRGPRSPWLLGAYVVGFVAVVHGTTPLLYDEPRYAYTYKHLGVIEWIASSGQVDRGIDVYNSWPGFFALNAWLSDVTGVPAESYAEWAQAAFNLLFAAVVLFAVSGVTSSTRTAWGAVWLFLIGNWVAQDYLAPQALGFALTLVLVGLALHAGRGVAPRLALAGGAVVFLAIVVSHQLSPVMAILAVGAIALATRRVPLWVPAAMVVVEGLWLVTALPVVRDRLEIFAIARGDSARPDEISGRFALDGVQLTAWSARILVVLMVGLAAWGAVLLARERRLRVPAALALAPLPAVVLSSYGGEVVLRAYLFALPWLALLAAVALVRAHPGRLAVASAVLAACLVPAYFGYELTARMSGDDVAAAQWFETHAPAGSAAIAIAPNVPERLTARYVALSRTDPAAFDHVLTRDPEFRGHRFGARDVERLATWADGLDARRAYVVLTPSQEHYLRLHGPVPPGSMSSLERALDRSDDFILAHRSGAARVYLRETGARRLRAACRELTELRRRAHDAGRWTPRSTRRGRELARALREGAASCPNPWR